MSGSRAPIAYRVHRAIYVPLLLAIGAAWLAIAVNPWALLAIPFIVLGSMCAAPNLNLADGFLAVFAMVLEMVAANYFRDAGSAVFLGTFASWVLGSIEKRLRATPIYGNDSPT